MMGCRQSSFSTSKAYITFDDFIAVSSFSKGGTTQRLQTGMEMNFSAPSAKLAARLASASATFLAAHSLEHGRCCQFG